MPFLKLFIGTQNNVMVKLGTPLVILVVLRDHVEQPSSQKLPV